MTISEAMDIVRSLCGKPDVDPVLLRFAMDEGRRVIERSGNFYWMAERDEDLALYEDVNEYSITSGVGNGFDLGDYKEARYAFVKEDTETEWHQLPIGSSLQAMGIVASDATGFPEAMATENETAFIYPTPDTLYNLVFFFFQWTENDTDITATDELFTRWPMLIISAALAVLVPLITKNKEDAAFWLQMQGTEIEKAKAFTNMRLHEMANEGKISASEAARILQAQGAK